MVSFCSCIYSSAWRERQNNILSWGGQVFLCLSVCSSRLWRHFSLVITSDQINQTIVNPNKKNWMKLIWQFHHVVRFIFVVYETWIWKRPWAKVKDHKLIYGLRRTSWYRARRTFLQVIILLKSIISSGPVGWNVNPAPRAQRTRRPEGELHLTCESERTDREFGQNSHMQKSHDHPLTALHQIQSHTSGFLITKIMRVGKYTG